MKKAILSTSLALIPSAIQYKALSKALNYLFCGQSELVGFEGVIVCFRLTDLKPIWSFKYDGHEFTECKKERDKSDVTCLMHSDIALALYSKQAIIEAIETGHIQFEGDPAYTSRIKTLLNGMSSQKIETLVDHLRSFLRLSPIERKSNPLVNVLGLDIKTITVSQLDTPEKVNLIRNMALNIESSDLPEALRLMKMAQQARPAGLLIRQKVQEYETLIKANS